MARHRECFADLDAHAEVRMYRLPGRPVVALLDGNKKRAPPKIAEIASAANVLRFMRESPSKVEADHDRVSD